MPRNQLSRIVAAGLRVLCVAACLSSLVFSAGCGPSKEEVKKQDEQGKELNDAAMKRMIQEQGGKPTVPPGK